jgi:hypothetical protein
VVVHIITRLVDCTTHVEQHHRSAYIGKSNAADALRELNRDEKNTNVWYEISTLEVKDV